MQYNPFRNIETSAIYGELVDTNGDYFREMAYELSKQNFIELLKDEVYNILYGTLDDRMTPLLEDILNNIWNNIDFEAIAREFRK